MLVVVFELPFVLELVLVDNEDLGRPDPVDVPVVLVVGPLHLAVGLFCLSILVGAVVLQFYSLLYPQLLLFLLPLLFGYLQTQIQLVDHQHLHVLIDPLLPLFRVYFHQQSSLQLVVVPHQLDVFRRSELLEIVLAKQLSIYVPDVLRKLVIFLNQDSRAQLIVGTLKL